MELIADPGFDDPTAWDITTNEGTAVVSGGLLTCTGWRGIIYPVGMGTGPGIISYTVVVNTFSGGGLAAVQNGADILWTGGYGTGTFTGTTTGQDLSIAISFTGSDLVIDSLSMDLAPVDITASFVHDYRNCGGKGRCK